MYYSPITIVLLIEYDGTNYAGWQSQLNAKNLQDTIEKAIFEITGIKNRLTGAGRTDSGVHARGQVATIKPDENLILKLPPEILKKAINSVLPHDIRILDILYSDKYINARFDAIGRQYSYSIITKESVFDRKYAAFIKFPLDIEKLFSCTEIFSGEHDFTTFSKHNVSTLNYTCNVQICEWKEIALCKFRLDIRSDRFVYGMVRALVGAMLDCARGKRSMEEIKASLEKKDRKLISFLAPANGLVLERIYYPKEFELCNKR